MPARRSHRHLVAPVPFVLAVVACAASMLPTGGIAASSSTIVGAKVPSAITLGNQCHQRSAWSLGSFTSGASAMSSTGAGVCRFTWASSNDSSMIRIHQADRAGAAMTGQTSTRSTIGPNPGAPFRFDGRGSVYVGAHSWWANPMRRSIDGGATFVDDASAGHYPTISMVDATTGWRAGPGGVQRSFDLGAATPTWTSTPTAVPAGGGNPVEVDALSATVAWVSKNARTYLTTDGGTTWVAKNAILSNSENVEALSSTTAFVTGWAGQLARTTDGNLSWSVSMTGINPNADGALVDVSVAPGSVSTVWFVNSTGVYRSTDSGTNWSATSALPDYLNPSMIKAITDTEAFVGGYDGLIYRTTNAGASWARVRTPLSGPVTSIVALSGTQLLVGEVDGATFVTSDGGATWNVALDTPGNVNDLDAVDRRNIVASDAFGRVRITTDLGATWTTQSTTVAPWPVRGVAIQGSADADGSELVLAVGDAGRISQSWDGGATWTARVSGTALDLWDVDVASDGVAIAVGADGTILRSSDWGATWMSVGAVAATLRRVDIHDDGSVLVVGNSGLIRRSTDAGLTWTTRVSGTTATLYSVSRPSAEVVYASGFGVLLKSTDGGLTWTSMASAAGSWASRVVAPTDDTVWMFDATFLGWSADWARRSIDGGQTWTSPMGGDRTDISTAIAFDTGRVLTGELGGGMRLTDAAPDIADYAPGSWAGGTARFGFCVQDRVGATAGAYAADDDGVCDLADPSEDDAAHWNPVPTTPTKLAQIASAGAGSIDLVWGLHVDGSVAMGEYTAGIVITAVAPNA